MFRVIFIIGARQVVSAGQARRGSGPIHQGAHVSSIIWIGGPSRCVTASSREWPAGLGPLPHLADGQSL